MLTYGREHVSDQWPAKAYLGLLFGSAVRSGMSKVFRFGQFEDFE